MSTPKHGKNTLSIAVHNFGCSLVDGTPYKIGLFRSAGGVWHSVTGGYDGLGGCRLYVYGDGGKVAKAFIDVEKFKEFTKELGATEIVVCVTPTQAFNVVMMGTSR